MHVIRASNINHALPAAIALLQQHGVPRTSRAGDTLEVPEPVATRYEFPTERVLFCPKRDANPFFHLHESLWILGGRDDVRSLVKYNKRMAEYSDDGKRFHGAYGARIAAQVPLLLDLLKRSPETRRALLTIWRQELDLNAESKDIPCNNIVWFKVRDGHLDMTVGNRSNDMLWGAYGANVVQFSFLQEYIAGRLGVQIGAYTQVSDSFHVYTTGPGGKLWETVQTGPQFVFDPYGRGHDPKTVLALPLFEPTESKQHWHHDLLEYLDEQEGRTYRTRFFNQVAEPMAAAWAAYKTFGADHAAASLREYINKFGRIDWLVAGLAWMARAQQRKRK